MTCEEFNAALVAQSRDRTLTLTFRLGPYRISHDISLPSPFRLQATWNRNFKRRPISFLVSLSCLPKWVEINETLAASFSTFVILQGKANFASLGKWDTFFPLCLSFSLNPTFIAITFGLSLADVIHCGKAGGQRRSRFLYPNISCLAKNTLRARRAAG